MIDSTLLLEDIIIQQNRISSPYNQQSRFIDIITNDEIIKSGATSISEVLQLNAAIDLRHRGANGVQADLSIRGGSFNQVLILIDGIKMSDPQTGHHNMNLPVSMNLVERIEIIKGPASKIYGQNAFSGAVNIITKKDVPTSVELNTDYSSNNTIATGISAALETSKSHHIIAYNFTDSEGYKYNTDYTQHHIFLKNQFQISDNSSLDITGGLLDNKFGANGFYASPDFVDQYEEVRTGYASASYKYYNNNYSIRTNSYWRNNKDHYVFLRDNPSFFENNHTSNSIGNELHLSYSNKYGTTGIGVEYIMEDLESNNLGSRERNNLGIYLEHEMNLFDNKLNLTPGIYFNKFDDRTLKLFPGLDMSFSLSDNAQLYSVIGISNRIPTYTNLYYSSPSELGNENLKDERTLSYEIGYKSFYKKSVLQVGLFVQNNRDLIDWVKNSPEDDIWRATNFSEVNNIGLDFSYRTDLSSLSSLLGNMTVGYTYISSSIGEADEPLFSRYALENLNHQFVVNMNFNLIQDKLSLNLVGRYSDRVNLQDYTLVDSKLMYRANKFNIYAYVNNLFNIEYRETNLVIMPGRWIGMGANIRFGSLK
jgi:iron complex outermembrane receptor protein